MFGPLLDFEMSKKCTRLWREATLHYAIHYATLHHYISPRYTTLHYSVPHYTTLRYTYNCNYEYNYTCNYEYNYNCNHASLGFNYTTLRQTTLHYN